MKVHIVLSSITFANNTKRFLDDFGIDCHVTQAPRAIAHRGCAYSAIVNKDDTQTAVDFIKSQEFHLLGVYEKRGDDMYERVL